MVLGGKYELPLGSRLCRDSPHLDTPQVGRVAGPESFEHVFGSYAEGAQAVQNRLLEASSTGEVLVDVQRVPVTVQPIKGGLVGMRLFPDSEVRRALRYLVGCRRIRPPRLWAAHSQEY